MSELCEVVITAPDPEWLLEITRQLASAGLCASAHNFTPVLHTRKSRVAEIVARVKAQHPYDVPGISTRPIEDGNPEYLDWMLSETETR